MVLQFIVIDRIVQNILPSLSFVVKVRWFNYRIDFFVRWIVRVLADLTIAAIVIWAVAAGLKPRNRN